MKLKATRFQVLNYRNIDDSGWIPLERVTAFVGRNEAGKTALLKALHQFNPATAEPYNPQREFPRDRFTAEFRDGEEWPVCRVEFELSADFRAELGERLNGAGIPHKAVLTRYYDGSLEYQYDKELPDDSLDPDELVKALDGFASDARRLPAPPSDQESAIQELRSRLADWADGHKEAVGELEDLRSEEGVNLLEQVRGESNAYAQPASADLVEALQQAVDQLRDDAKRTPLSQRLDEAVEAALPVFIYFENYGILDSAVYLPRFLQDLASRPENPRVRTINAMFKHVELTAQEISDLGREEVAEARAAGQPLTGEMIARDQQRKELRSVKLNSASLDISRRFSAWFGQRRHKIRYQADGPYFRIWISDDRRPDVDIELESRSKGFQWFFSFYLVFLVESDEGHKDAILLLDEPGLHLHPTAQQELMGFFETLSKDNPLIYTTHSPFLIDGKRIHRVRPVTEDETGHSRISVDGWPKDRETIFPLQAAAGYAMVRGLFQHKKNVLVEGMSDYLYLHALNLHCHALGRQGLPDDVYITPCGGTKLVGHIASLFLGQEVRPVVLLDGDDAGRARRDALMKELYAGHEKAVLMLSDVLGEEECETEDIIGEATMLSVLKGLVKKRVTLNQDDRGKGSLVDQIKSAAERHGTELPTGWKAEVARRIVVEWSTVDPKGMLTDVLDRAEALFKELTVRFADLDGDR
ncbi:MAG: AAA family ATPase [Holophagales bacterium]|nr:AAA family ATPase [Holophagales bacterium]MYG31789.1 AAA family ATPase [Holophagales bacterium]MYI79631.1 AAA family ATPase [Holophagales bacterium]